MNTPVMIDFYCGVGGATKGYQRAGFRVIGVDKEPQPNYCGDEFIQEDALVVLADLARFMPVPPALVHASCPCQEANTLANGTNGANGWGRAHVQLVPATRAALERLGVPYVIEQPTASRKGTIRRDLTLCMDMFHQEFRPPPWVQRHRSFEISGFTVPQPWHPAHKGYVRGMRHGAWRDGPYVAAYGKGGGKATVAEMKHALGIDWAGTREELTEAIPPKYAEHIGRAFLATLA